MPHFHTGDIMDEHTKYDGCFFTSNGVLNKQGALVMGKGFAATINRHFPRLSPALGHAIKLVGELAFEPRSRRYQGVYAYGIIPPDTCLGANDHYLTTDEGGWLPRNCQSRRWGAFQTKGAFWDPSPVDGIKASVDALRRFARKHAEHTYCLNYPGIGLGELTRASVEPLLAPLPDNIHIYSLDVPTEQDPAA